MSWDNLPEEIKTGIIREVEQQQEEIRRTPARVWLSELDGCLVKSFYRRVAPLPLDFRKAVALWRGSLLHPVLLKHFKEQEVPVSYPIFGEELTLSGKIDGIESDGTIAEIKTSASLFYHKKRNKPNYWDAQRVMCYARIRGVKKATLYYLDFSDVLKFPLLIDFEEAERILQGKVELAKKLHNALLSGEPPEPINILKFENEATECEWCEFKGVFC